MAKAVELRSTLKQPNMPLCEVVAEHWHMGQSNPASCKRHAGVVIDGYTMCRQHAAIYALDLILAETKVTSRRAPKKVSEPERAGRRLMKTKVWQVASNTDRGTEVAVFGTEEEFEAYLDTIATSLFESAGRDEPEGPYGSKLLQIALDLELQGTDQYLWVEEEIEIPRALVLDKQEIATLMAALKFYDDHDQGDPFNRTEEIHELAQYGDQISSDHSGIMALFEKIKEEA